MSMIHGRFHGNDVKVCQAKIISLVGKNNVCRAQLICADLAILIFAVLKACKTVRVYVEANRLAGLAEGDCDRKADIAQTDDRDSSFMHILWVRIRILLVSNISDDYRDEWFARVQ